MKEIKAEILSIGTEILLGNIVNTNAAYLSQELAALGILVYHQAVVGDNPGRLSEALAEAYSRAELVITTGGLGPTTDDLSKETAAAFFGRRMVRDERALDELVQRLKLGGHEVTPNNYKQADLPEGATVLYNKNGTAPGFILEGEGRTLIMLPGPPSEMKPMFEEGVRPYLRKHSDQMLISKTLHICGIGESAVEHRLKKRMDELVNPTLAPYAKTGMVDLRITAKAAAESEAMALIEPVEQEIRDMFGEYVFGSDEETLEGTIIEMLAQRGWSVTTAESCTGGLLAGRLVDYPGASRVFREGYITYANEAKEEILGVSRETLERYGAVSAECAREMAAGAAKKAGAQAAIAVTGIAGPTGAVPAHGDQPEKPVGLVYIGYYVNGEVTSEEHHFYKNRRANRDNAVVRALNGLRMRLLAVKESPEQDCVR